jgi:uncharacterized protein
MFNEIIQDEAALRAIIGNPNERVVAKAISQLDDICRAFIAASPFLLIASSDAHGRADVSPKGDPAGFVHVLDDHHLAIPDRPGNRRADTLSNVLQNPHVGILFLIPGNEDTLRVNGMVQIVRDLALRERLTMQGKTPELALVVRVEEIFLHCAKCMRRSKLWATLMESTPATKTSVPSLAQAMVTHAQLSMSVEEMDALIQRDYETRLY